MTAPGGTVREMGWADELAAAAHLHSRDTLLPALDETLKRKLDRLPTTPAGVELFARLEVDAEVVNVDRCTRGSFGAAPLFDIDDHELSWFWSLEELDLWLASR